MRHSIRRSRIAILTIQFLFFLTPALHAHFMTYSWSGRLVPYDDLSPDPWLIGADGVEFRLDITVDSSVTDNNSSQIPFAAFAARSCRLWVNGQEASFKGDAYIDFASIDGVADIVSGGGIFALSDTDLEISSGVQLAQDTFTFFRDSETPPRFDATYTTGRGSAGRPPYATVVYQGALVTVVPEPNCVAMISLIVNGLLLRRK